MLANTQFNAATLTRRKARKAGSGFAELMYRPIVEGNHQVSLILGTDLKGRQIELTSTPNRPKKWQQENRLSQEKRRSVWRAFHLMEIPELPVDVKIIRLMGRGKGGRDQREFDDDNATAGGKAFRDGVADLYGVNDRDKSKIKFSVSQERAELGVPGVRIVITARRAAETGGTP